MANLVFLSKENIPLTTSEIIAKALEKRHHDVIELIRNHEKVINNFGKVLYKSANSEAFKTLRGAIKEKKVAYLTEEQATIVICLMRNSPKVLEFKVRLVRAFFEMRQQLQQNQPKTNALPNYTPAQVETIREKARKQGYAIACSYFKKDDSGLTANDRKQLEKIKEFIDWFSEKRVSIHEAWKKQREIAHQLRELTYQFEQSSDILSLLFGGYVGTVSEVSYYLNNKLQEANK